MNTYLRYILLIACLSSQISIQAQEKKIPYETFLSHPWVDSVLQSLTPSERAAQLIMVAAFSNKNSDHELEISKLIEKQKIGGLIFFQGGPARQANLINQYQRKSKIPLLIAMDAEWGLGMRLDSTISFPYQMTLGAIQNDDLIYQMGLEIANQLKESGTQVNFAPVADVNNNPLNPVINFRSFGENKYAVSKKAASYMRGLQDGKVLATAKHFPGHGDTETDSHYALPLINHTRERLDSLELYPFRELIRQGIGAIMVAHLNIPALEPKEGPSTLSKKIITDLLKNELGFKGLIVTDAMNMKGVTQGNTPGVVDKDALLAGNDLLEFTEDVPRTIDEIMKAVKNGLITQKEIDDRCRKILAIKYWVGLANWKPIDPRSVTKKISTPKAQLLNRNLTEASLTVLNNKYNLLPLKRLDTLSIASVSIAANTTTPFQCSLGLYAKVNHFFIPNNATAKYVDSIKSELVKYNLIVAGIHDNAMRPLNKWDVANPVTELIEWITVQKKSVFAVFKNPYVLDKIKSIEQADALVVTYQDNVNAEELSAQLIFGGVSATGRLPVTVGAKFKSGDGLDVKGDIRFKYTLPEDAGMDSKILNTKIDSLVGQALAAHAIPGCMVLVAKDKKIVFHKAYGLQQYNDSTKVKLDNLYDLASVTKISTSVPALMKLYDEGKFSLDATLGDYLPAFRRSNKSDIPMYDILTHQARFQAWIAFWKNTIRKNGSYKWHTFKTDSSAQFPIRVKGNMYLHKNYPDKMVNEIRKSNLIAEKKYLYSDFFFILAPRVVESMIDQRFEQYLDESFYASLGAPSITFNPLKKYPINAIIPTENDYNFRHQPIWGTVHDEGAIMLGGVSGHAGLFANANDLAKLMQMFLDKGEYGGQRYINTNTFTKWTTVQFPENNNRRGLGFDKPNLTYLGENNNAAKDASAESFGHTGFTGTMTWMDPENGLLYIFLSNRVTPTRENTRLYQLNTRTKIQQVMYDAIIK